MKRYIRASYDSSMPDWLKSEAGKKALGSLTDKYAISQAKFSKNPTEGSIPVYLLDDVYKEASRWGETYKTREGQYVYVPSMSYTGYDRYLDTGASYRSLPKVAKSRLQEHIIDTVYMTAPERREIWKERDYQDPRSLYKRNGEHAEYAGQYPEYGEHYNKETGEWESDTEPYEWSVRRGTWDGRKRDKSGYEIPNPEDLYKRLYQRFPDRLKARINEVKATLDEYYDKINDAKNTLFSGFDIRKGKVPYSRYDDKYSSPYYYLTEAIDKYGDMYKEFDKCIESDGSVNSSKLAEFMKGGSYNGLVHCAAAIDSNLENFYKKINLYK